VNNGYAADTNFFLAATSTPPCTLNTASPSVTICTPDNNATVTSPVTVSAGTTDSKPVTKTQLFVDGIQKFTASSGTLKTSISLSAGTHRLTVQATDTAGTIFKQTIYITVSTTGGGCTASTVSPSVTICSPANNATVSSPVAVKALTTDTAHTVSYVQAYVDGVAKVTQQGATLSTSIAMTSGAHRLTVQAKDSAGTIFKQTVNITVQ
jgi:hypothetical protein